MLCRTLTREKRRCWKNRSSTEDKGNAVGSVQEGQCPSICEENKRVKFQGGLPRLALGSNRIGLTDIYALGLPPKARGWKSRERYYERRLMIFEPHPKSFNLCMSLSMRVMDRHWVSGKAPTVIVAPSCSALERDLSRYLVLSLLHYR